MRPLFLAAARPMKVEWKMSPYLGVLPFVFSALECDYRDLLIIRTLQLPACSLLRWYHPHPETRGLFRLQGGSHHPRGRRVRRQHPVTAITTTARQLYLNKAFSAPRICTVDAGYLARFVRLPAWEMRRAPTCGGGRRVSGGGVEGGNGGAGTDQQCGGVSIRLRGLTDFTDITSVRGREGALHSPLLR